MKKYVIFDFDGTMVNTNDIIVESWQATFEHYLGHRKPVREIEAAFGETLKNTIATKIPDAAYEEVRDYYRDYQDTHCKDRVYVFSGVRELLTELRESGCRIGVATSRTTYSYQNYMKELRLEGLVDETITMDDVTRHKPEPDSILRVLEKLGGSPEEAIMIGDTKYDVGCAMNAGVDSVLVGWSHYVDEEDMAASGFAPTYRVRTPEELLVLIKKI